MSEIKIYPKKENKKYGFTYLGGVGISKKLKKNIIVSKQYTYALYLAPHKLSGYNVCKHSTPECRLGCLYNSGQGGMRDEVKNARINRTKLFFENRNKFMEILIKEIKHFHNLAKKDNYGFSVRLNATSDIEWENIYYKGNTIFEIFPDIQFYDYTKNHNRILFKSMPKNYYLTLSYTGRNKELCFEALKQKKNVAVVFNITGNIKQLPTKWYGYKVIDGDITDYRPDDLNGVVIGLRYKNLTSDKTINKIIRKSIFVQQLNDNVTFKPIRFQNERIKVVVL